MTTRKLYWFRCVRCEAWEIRKNRGRCTQCGGLVIKRSLLDGAPSSVEEINAVKGDA